MHALYPVADIRAIEQAALAQTAPGELMQRAGNAVAAAAFDLLPHGGPAAEVLVLAGPGNNGGDALIAAGLLARQGIRITILLGAEPVTPDAAAAVRQARASQLRIVEGAAIPAAPAPYALAIDGLFGIGLSRPIDTALGALVTAVNRLPCPVLAIDVPSGLDSDTGAVVGAGAAIRATHTVTFIGDKPGLHTASGRDLAGTVTVADLDIPAALFPVARMHLNTPQAFAGSLRPRAHDTHKGSYGDVVIVGGAPGMAGAPVLAARVASHCGAGRVIAAFSGPAPAYDAVHPELMFRSAQGVDLSRATVVIGPGLGSGDAARSLILQVIESDRPAIIDADALNLIASDAGLRETLTRRQGITLLTPHPLEAARLLDSDSATVQADRVTAARALAQRYGCIAILKGSGTVIAAPDGAIAINPTGNPALATAGTGDVLAGVCGALIAQHWNAWDAACGAPWLHGKAADLLVASGTGPIGLTASELIPAVREALNQVVGTDADNAAG